MGEVDREYIGLLKSSAKMPVVFLDFYYKDIAQDAVVTDGFYGMYLMAEYLYERGFRRMAYVGSIHATSSIMDRYCGFRRCLLEHGVPFREEWLLESPMYSRSTSPMTISPSAAPSSTKRGSLPAFSASCFKTSAITAQPLSGAAMAISI